MDKFKLFFLIFTQILNTIIREINKKNKSQNFQKKKLHSSNNLIQQELIVIDTLILIKTIAQNINFLIPKFLLYNYGTIWVEK